MRTLMFLTIGLFVLVGIVFSNAMERRSKRSINKGKDDIEPDLSARLKEAAVSFSTAAETLNPDHTKLKTALTDLATKCEALATRAGPESVGFMPSARAAIVRLLLALYGVVERLVPISKQGESNRTAPLLEAAAELIIGATEALTDIAEQAEATELRHLEADLDVLRDRLEQID